MSTVRRVQLYVAGDGPNSLTAVTNLRGVLARYPGCVVEIEIIDVISSPESGVRAGVLITPMLLELDPPPERRLLGNLEDHSMLVAALGLDRGQG